MIFMYAEGLEPSELGRAAPKRSLRDRERKAQDRTELELKWRRKWRRFGARSWLVVESLDSEGLSDCLT